MKNCKLPLFKPYFNIFFDKFEGSERKHIFVLFDKTIKVIFLGKNQLKNVFSKLLRSQSSEKRLLQLTVRLLRGKAFINLQQNKMRAFKSKNLQSLFYKPKSVIMAAKASNTISLKLKNENYVHQANTFGYGFMAVNYFSIKDKIELIQPNMLVPFPQKERVLSKFQNYSFKVLNYTHRKEALKLLAQAFDQKQPITSSFNKKHPHLKGVNAQNWESYWHFYLNDLINSGLSVAVFDNDNYDEMIGIVVAKDYRVTPTGYEQKFLSTYNVVSQTMGLANFIIGKLDTRCQQILQDRAVVDLFGGTIKEGHMGKKLFSKILQLNVKLAKEMGYEYAFTYVTNFKSQPTLQKLHFQKVGGCDCSKYKVGGLKPFQVVGQLHKNPSIWLKRLR